jgi:hypothetical protein
MHTTSDEMAELKLMFLHELKISSKLAFAVTVLFFIILDNLS